jgi:hypothetical protein
MTEQSCSCGREDLRSGLLVVLILVDEESAAGGVSVEFTGFCGAFPRLDRGMRARIISFTVPEKPARR